MLSRNLEQSLHRALALATERNHEFATLEQKSSFEILIDGRIQKEDEVSIEMDFTEMFKGLDMPQDNDVASLGIFKTNISTYSMCEQID